MRQWVIPDIHGCKKTLISLVEQKIKPTSEDELIFIGDYIDRGPDSKGVIDYVIKLQESEISTICLLGNHEDAMLRAFQKEVKIREKKHFFPKRNRALKFWMNIGGDATLKSFNVKKVTEIPEKYFLWIENLQLIYETSEYIIVHAGLNFEIENPFEDKEAMTTIRDFDVDLKKTNQRKVIHGHVQLSLDFIKSSVEENMSFIGLDNGCVHRSRIGMGNLIAFEINSKKFEIQPNIDLI
jgi:serine/threonine protein phosphatase 1